jgi:hypothetical protein
VSLAWFNQVFVSQLPARSLLGNHKLFYLKTQAI